MCVYEWAHALLRDIYIYIMYSMCRSSVQVNILLQIYTEYEFLLECCSPCDFFRLNNYALILRNYRTQYWNERIRGTTKPGDISKKVQERSLKWYVHVMRRDKEYVGKRVMRMWRGG